MKLDDVGDDRLEPRTTAETLVKWLRPLARCARIGRDGHHLFELGHLGLRLLDGLLVTSRIAIACTLQHLLTPLLVRETHARVSESGDGRRSRRERARRARVAGCEGDDR